MRPATLRLFLEWVMAVGQVGSLSELSSSLETATFAVRRGECVLRAFLLEDLEFWRGLDPDQKGG